MSFRNVTIGAMTVSTMFIVELTMVPLLLPSIQEQFGLNTNQLASVFNSYGLCVAIGVLFSGLTGGALSHIRVFASGVLAFAFGSLAVAFAPSYDLMIPARMIQGLGAGMFSPLVPILLTKASGDQPGKALMVWGGVTRIVAALAPIIYVNLVTNPNYETVFIFLAVAAVAGLIAVMMSASKVPGEQKRSLPNFAQLLKATDLWFAYGYVVCTYGAFTYFLFRFPLILTENGQPTHIVGLLLSAMWLSYSILSVFLKNLVDGPRLPTILMAAPVFIGGGFVLLSQTTELGGQAIAGLAVAAGLACSNTPSLQLILKFAPSGQDALCTSLDITFARLGGVVTVAVLATASLNVAALAIAVLSTIALICGQRAINGFQREALT